MIEDRGYGIGTVTYQYMNLWSSLWTWGGRSPPESGTIVAIANDARVFLDISTPILKVLVIDNATLIFNDLQDIPLHLEYLLIINGGRLQIGTAAQPFQHRATVTLYGDLRSIEIPLCKKHRFRFSRNPIRLSFRWSESLGYSSGYSRYAWASYGENLDTIGTDCCQWFIDDYFARSSRLACEQ